MRMGIGEGSFGSFRRRSSETRRRHSKESGPRLSAGSYLSNGQSAVTVCLSPEAAVGLPGPLRGFGLS